MTTYLVTGGTGSFGKKFIEVMLRDNPPERLILFSTVDTQEDLDFIRSKIGRS